MVDRTPLAERPGSTEPGRSEDFLLVDHQIRATRGSVAYTRMITRLVTQPGVDSQSQITISFDPVKERVLLHDITVIRGTEVQNRLKSTKIEVLRREKELEDGLLNGQLSLHLVLNDVRVGDVIDYSYSMESSTPEWGNRYYVRRKAGWGVPVGAFRFRVSAPADTPFKVRLHAMPEPRVEEAQGWRTYEWTTRNLPAVHEEKNTPPGVEQYPAVEMTQFASWGELATIARSLYEREGPASTEVAAAARQITAGAGSDEEKAVRLLHFVQDEIRYTGVELGEGAYRPREPALVLKRRYGDCKDKVQLLVSLYREAGLKADPVLVSTYWRGHIADHAPNPSLFDHVIARATVSGHDYWLDATSTGQGGALGTLVQAHFGAGLVLAAGTSAPVAMPAMANDQPLEVATTEFDLRRGAEAEGTLSVRTEYAGTEAERIRRELKNQALSELSDEYTKYYRKTYSGVSAVAPIQVTDDVVANRIVVVESYRIAHPFELNGDGKLEFSIDTALMNESIKAPEDTTRTLPLSVRTPEYIVERTRVLLPEPWNIHTGTTRIESPAFRYRSVISHTGDVVDIEYTFQTLADSVAPSDLKTHSDRLRAVRRDTGYNLTKSPPTKDAGAKSKPTGQWAWVGWLAGLYVMFLGLRYLLVARAYLSIAIPAPEAEENDGADLDPGERRLLEAYDAALLEAGLVPVGYVRHSPYYTIFQLPEWLRVFRHPEAPVCAYVARRPDPETGEYVTTAAETVLADGRVVCTASFEFDETTLRSGWLKETLHGATPKETIARHRARLEHFDLAGARPHAPTLADAAHNTRTELDRRRTILRLLRWAEPSSDPGLDRITLQGALALGRRGLRLVRERRKRQAESRRSVSDGNDALKVEADFANLRHTATAPRQAPGLPRGLIALSLLTALISVAAMTYLWDLRVAATVLVVLFLHELGHALAMRISGYTSVQVFFIPAFGALTIGRGAEPGIRARVGILLAGPVPGVLIAMGLFNLHLHFHSPLALAAATTFLLINAFNLLPLMPLDGGRLFEACTRIDGLARIVLAIVSAASFLIFAIVANQPSFTPLAVVGLFLLPRQIALTRLARRIRRHVGATGTWTDYARAALTEMTDKRFMKWSWSQRQQRARAIADQLSAPPPTRRDRAVAIAAYIVSVVLTVAALTLWAHAS